MKSERLLLYVLAAAMFTHIMDFMIIMPLGPQLMRLFDISARDFSLLVASYTVTAGVSGFLAAFFIDRYDRKKTLLAVYVGFAIGTLACALAPTFYFLLIARSISGMFGGVLGANKASCQRRSRITTRGPSADLRQTQCAAGADIYIGSYAGALYDHSVCRHVYGWQCRLHRERNCLYLPGWRHLHPDIFSLGGSNGGQARAAEDLHDLRLTGDHSHCYHHEPDADAPGCGLADQRDFLHLQQRKNGTFHHHGNRDHQS